MVGQGATSTASRSKLGNETAWLQPLNWAANASGLAWTPASAPESNNAYSNALSFCDDVNGADSKNRAGDAFQFRTLRMIAARNGADVARRVSPVCCVTGAEKSLSDLAKIV